MRLQCIRYLRTVLHSAGSQLLKHFWYGMRHVCWIFGYRAIVWTSTNAVRVLKSVISCSALTRFVIWIITFLMPSPAAAGDPPRFLVGYLFIGSLVQNLFRDWSRYEVVVIQRPEQHSRTRNGTYQVWEVGITCYQSTSVKSPGRREVDGKSVKSHSGV